MRGVLEAVRLAGDVHVFPDYVADLRRLGEGLPVTFTGRFEREDAARIYATTPSGGTTIGSLTGTAGLAP